MKFSLYKNDCSHWGKEISEKGDNKLNCDREREMKKPLRRYRPMRVGQGLVLY